MSAIVADTAYTERYMGFATPDDNSAGYDVSFGQQLDTDCD